MQSQVLRRASAVGVHLVETRFAPNANLAEHAHDRAFFCLALRGPFHELTRGRRLERENGSVVFHPPAETHADRFGRDGGACFNIELDDSWDEQLGDLLPALRQKPPRLARGASTYCEKLRVELWRSPAPSPLRVEGLSLLLLADAAGMDDEHHAWHPPRWIYAVRDYLHDAFRASPSLAQAARTARAHPVHVARVFRRAFGCSIATYVRRLRLEEARRQLVLGSEPIAEIACDAGFADQSHLTRAFRREFGTTPSRYRQNRGGR